MFKKIAVTICLIVLSASANAVEINWTEHIIDGEFDGAWVVISADINGDYHKDIVGASSIGDEIAVWINNGEQIFNKFVVTDSFDNAWDVYASDVDGDGDIDLLGAASYGDKITWWENLNTEGFIQHDISSDFDGATSVYAADMDGDGDTDVLGAAAVAGRITWWENDGEQAFLEHDIDADFNGARAATAVDIDGDGDLDVVAVSSSLDAISWWENDGNMVFIRDDITTDFDGATALYAVDMDNDSDVDIIAAGRYADKISWWENDGAQNFIMHEIDTLYNGAQDVYAVDLDGDNDIDIIGAAWEDDQVAWWENNGSQVFTKHIIDDSFAYAHSVYAVDLDSEGDIDIIGAAFTADDISWWESDINPPNPLPEITDIVNDPPVPAIGEECQVSATVTDNFWIESVNIYADFGNGYSFREMEGIEDSFYYTLPGLPEGIIVNYYITATDNLGDSTVSDTLSYQVNQLPIITEVFRSPDEPQVGEQCVVSTILEDPNITLSVDHADLHYDNGGGYTIVPMSNQADSFFATIPGQSNNTLVTYYVSVFDDLGDSTFSDTFSYYVTSNPLLSLEVVPDTSPVIVRQGESFDYNGTLANATPLPQTTEFWVMLDMPGYGLFGPLHHYRNISLAPEQVIETIVTQEIPQGAPLGIYSYIGYCGEYQSFIEDSSFFEFAIIPGIKGNGRTEWTLNGWFEDDSPTFTSSGELHAENYPNPFNAKSQIEFTLSETENVRLDIYNLLGQKVVTIIDSRLTAGTHSVTWDASDYSSGTYFYRLSVGGRILIKRMTLLK